MQNHKIETIIIKFQLRLTKQFITKIIKQELRVYQEQILQWQWTYKKQDIKLK